MTPELACRAASSSPWTATAEPPSQGLLRPRHMLPVHYGDCTVMKSPLADFLAAAERRGLGQRVVRWRHGQQGTITSGATTVTVL
jgi:L-ascorbate metabolism protein UlaG (beta-lactamase superfamily)